MRVGSPERAASGAPGPCAAGPSDLSRSVQVPEPAFLSVDEDGACLFTGFLPVYRVPVRTE